jgi:DNA-binding transcriptional regulator YiaG
MTNIATVLKSEITRLARKQSRAEVDALKKQSSAHRSEIASLKRRVLDLEKALKALSKLQVQGSSRKADVASGSKGGEPQAALRFSAKGFASNRKRLGLSAAEFALLIGTTEQSIYAWEKGSTQPRAKYLQAIAALRGAGKREVAAQLDALKDGAAS